MQRKQIFSRLITILVILAQVLAGVSSALPAQVALAAAPTPPLVQPAKPSAVSAAANPALAAPRNPEDRTARAAGPELIRPAAPEVVAAAPVAKPLAAGGPASISGLVYSDFNANGVKDTSDVGVGGITVTAYDATGAVIASTLASTTTATLGQYTLSGLPASTPVRLEFTALPAGYQPAVHGAVNGTAVQLVTTTSGALSNVNFGISYPSDYCQNNPFLCTAEMIAGDPQNATTATYSVLKKWSYSLANGSVTPTNLANDNLVGTVWGLAYARGTDKLYSAAFLKRHAGLGPNGLGAIYVTSNPRSGTGLATSLFFDVATVSGINVGTVPSNSARGLTTPSGTALDAAVYDQVGKVGLGDIDISDDESTLWTISLNDKKLLGIPVNNPTPGTVQVYTIPDPGCAVGSGDYRPFATKYYHARLYVGVTCDASISRNQNDLKAVVYRFDPANPSAGFTNVLNVPLNYTKGAVNTSCPSNSGARWYPWVNTPYPTGFNPTCGAAGQKLLPQPLLSDLEFDLDDSLILGFIDRFAHQAGSGIALPDGSNTGETNAGGDILRAWNNSGVFVLENNGRAGSVAGGVGNNQGPGGGEFYQGDFIASLPNIVNEDANGGLAFLAGSGEVVSTVWDPLTNDAHHGVTFFSNTDGNPTRRHDIGGSVQFGKGSGLGDLEILCNSAPIEIGNRVWLDSDGDGVQDAGEPSLANVAVSLYDSSNNRLATVDTDAQGAYYFSSAPGTDTFNAKYNLAALQPNTSGYQVRIDTTQFALRGLGLTTADADSSANGDARDSDAQMSGSNAVSTFATGGAGANNHTYDFGFKLTGVGIGNYVWKDNNANGLQESGEPGIPGVTVGLYDNSGNPALCPQPSTTNLALNQTATQVSLYGAGYEASKAVDGNTASGMSITGSSLNSWWQVDLGQSAQVRQVVIYARPDGFHAQTEQIYVLISNQPFASTTLATTLADPNVWSSTLQGAWTGASLTIAVPTYLGRYVRIQHNNTDYLSLGEVQVFGNPNAPLTTITDSSGHYTFTSVSCLQPSTAYQVRLDLAQTPLTGLSLTTPNAGGVTSNDPTGDDSDSDANSVTISGKPTAVISLTSPAAGVNYSYDFGFAPLEIGNYVWKDSNANGQQDGGEPGIPGITVGLYDATGNAALCPQVGRYDTYADGFNSGVANGSTGSLPWGTTWSFAGSAAAYGAQGNAGGSMYIYGATNSTASRTVDLSVFVAPPTLRLDYIQGNGPANFNVQYSTNGGTSFTTLAALSVNNTSYKTITYTLPITLANTQIRIQGVNGGGSIYAYFDNVTLQGQVRYPVTTVTDANGLYTFTGTNCVQPNTTYQVRLATNQSPLTNLHLTTQDAGGVTSNDPTGDDTDSDAASVTISNTLYARLTALSPAVGTNYSYDFGFAPDIGTIVLRKVTMPAGSSQSFAFTSNVPGYANFSLRAGTSYTLTQVPVGVYAVTETLPTGWTQIASSCTNMNTLGAIQVSKDSLTTCTVTNAPQPTTSNVLTVTKTVNWNSNAPNAGLNFNINITGPSFPGGKADTISAGQTKVYTNVVGGVYTVTETSPGTGWVMTYSVPSGVVNLSAATIAPTTAGPLSGNVFRDFNADGVDAGASEPGVAGVTVTAYDPNGVVRGTATTDASGNYNFTPTGSGPYRLELTNLPAGYYPTTHGTGNGTSTQFVTTNGGASNVNFGVNDPADYSQSNPMMAAPLYINGNPDTTAPTDAIVKFAYNSSGQSPAPATLSTKAQIGSTWGLAYARMRKTLYASAFLKRHVGLGPNGPGAIYAINGNTGSSTLFADLAALGVNVGTVLSNSARGLGTPTTPNNDASTYAQIGKVGLGDIDIADDERMLYAVNLYDQKLYALNVPAGTLFGSYTIPDPGCSGGAWRPFGLKYKQGALYVGGVCDAQTSQSATDLKAYIYRFTPGTGTFTQVFNFALNYTKGNPPSVGCTGNGWFAWRDTFAPACGSVSGVPGVIYPQPILSDIEFDVDGSMILGFIDRLGHQQGAFNYGPTGTTIYFAASGGDILRAYNNNGTYVLENNGKAGALTTAGANNGQGPGYGEFYYGENWQDLHQETSNGGLALKPGSGEVALTAFDPVVAETGGVYWLSNTTGNQTRGYQLYGVNRTVNFNKGNGLGDLELLSDPAPLEIGDRVWKDLNGNGVQDPGEPGLANVTVALQSPTNTVTTNTDANGLYYFRVSPNTAYTLTVNPSQTPLNGLTLTQANMQAISGSPYNSDALLDTRDSDAVTIGGKATIYYTTGSAGQNNHGLDFGWTPAANGKVTINNKAPRVDWGDNPDQYGTTITKTGAAHIIVPGLRLGATEDTEIDGQANNTATGDGTDEDGVQFPPLTVGRTAVLTVTATNTGSTAATIYGWIDFNGDGQFTASERVTTTVPAGTVNGVFYLTYSVPADAVSDTYARFRLSTDPVAAQPTGVASDGEVEDYPVTIQAVPLVQFGDRVWLESDADGLAGTGVITPIVGMVITATAGTNIYTATTDSQGYYSFTVAPGFYSVSYGNVPPQYGTVLPSATPGGGTAYGNEGSYREAGNPDESYTSPTYVSLVDGEANWHVDFAFHAPHADLHLVKQVNKTVAKSGDTAVYTLVLTNNGPDTTTNVTVDDLLPATVLYQSATAQQGAYDANTGVWTVGTLAVNSSVTLTITVKVR